MNESVALSSVTDSFFSKDGINDDADIKIEAPKIYGRHQEQQLLMNAFLDLKQHNRNRSTVLMHGCSGAGKTALVQQLFASLSTSEEAYFCGGKYFQNSSLQEPYSAIMAAFSDLCDFVSQSDDFDEKRKLKIRRLLGQAVNVLTMHISNLSPFLDATTINDDPSEDMSDELVLYKFKIACKTFLQAMSSGDRPIVIFLDDIQWMDHGSKHLLEMLLSDSLLKNVMFIFAYRDEEAEIVMESFANVDKNDFVDIHVEALSHDQVTDLIAGLMKTPVTDELKRLGGLVQKRSNGNTFHVLQFMETIERDELITFDNTSGSWSFNVEEIQCEMMASDTLADLLLRRIQLLPPEEQEMLKIASLIGYEFEGPIISEVLRIMSDKSMFDEGMEVSLTNSTSVKKAIDIGIVEAIKNGKSFIFSHDKLQSSFQSMLTASEEKELHEIIGEVYLAYSDEDSVYHAVIHLNETIDAKHSPEFYVRLARLNLKASQYCKSRSAFDVATSLLRVGLLLLEGDQKWLSNFDLAFEITESLARMELTIGHLDECKRLTDETLSHAKSLDMKMNSLLIDADCQMAGNEQTTAFVTAFSALAVLGIKMPHKASAGHVVMKYLRIRRLLRGKTDDDILDLPILENRVLAAATKILVNVGWYCLMQNEDTPGGYAILCAVELTLRHGLSSHSATAMIFYGAVEISFGRHASALRFGRLAMTMMDRFKCRNTECVAISVWVTLLGHWEAPLKDLRSTILDAVEAGFETGDTMYTALAISNAFGMAFYVDHNLQQLEGYMRSTYNRLLDLSQEAMLLWVQPAFQTVLNLQRETTNWKDLTELSGEIMDEAEYYRKVADKKHSVMKVVAWIYKGALAYDFLYVDMAAEIFASIAKIGKAFQNNYGSLSICRYASLSNYELYGRTGKRKYLKSARKWKRDLEQFKAKGNHNATTATALLKAQDLSVQKSATTESVVSAYDVAIAATANQENCHFEAQCNQCAGFFLAKRGMYDEAEVYLNRCIALNSQWGATSLVEWLVETRSQVLPMKHTKSVAELVGESIVLTSAMS